MTRDWINELGQEVTGMGKTRRAHDIDGDDTHAPAMSTSDLLLADIASEWLRYKRRREQASAKSLRKRLKKAMEDPAAAGVILLIDSPGGSPEQASLMYEEILRQREAYPDKPVHVVVGALAASAGYYIAAAGDNIYANQASLIGSIGVRLDSFGAVDALTRLGFESRLITSGEHKGFLDPFTPVDEVAQAHMQSVLDSVHEQFIRNVRTGRGERLQNDPKLFSGLVWTGEQALKLGLIDGLLDVHSVARDVIGAEEIKTLKEKQRLIDKLSQDVGVAIATALRPRVWLQ